MELIFINASSHQQRKNMFSFFLTISFFRNKISLNTLSIQNLIIDYQEATLLVRGERDKIKHPWEQDQLQKYILWQINISKSHE
jgi:hypothetical protein